MEACAIGVMIEQLLGKAATVAVAGAEKSTVFSLFALDDQSTIPILSFEQRIAGPAGFFILIQFADRPARYGEPSRFDTMPSQPSAQACL
jgi:hypothetical protein